MDAQGTRWTPSVRLENRRAFRRTVGSNPTPSARKSCEVRLARQSVEFVGRLRAALAGTTAANQQPMMILVSAAIAEAFADRIRDLDAAIEVASLHPDGSITPSAEGIEVAFKSEDVGPERETLLSLAGGGGVALAPHLERRHRQGILPAPARTGPGGAHQQLLRQRRADCADGDRRSAEPRAGVPSVGRGPARTRVAFARGPDAGAARTDHRRRRPRGDRWAHRAPGAGAGPARDRRAPQPSTRRRQRRRAGDAWRTRERAAARGLARPGRAADRRHERLESTPRRSRRCRPGRGC